MAPIKYEIGPATEKFGTRLITDVHGDVIAEVPMLLNSKMPLDERCAERDRRAQMIVNALNNHESYQTSRPWESTARTTMRPRKFEDLI
jgi:hypothetical protein